MFFTKDGFVKMMEKYFIVSNNTQRLHNQQYHSPRRDGNVSRGKKSIFMLKGESRQLGTFSEETPTFPSFYILLHSRTYL